MAHYNWIVADLETQYSADNCRHCYGDVLTHAPLTGKCFEADTTFAKLGWENKAALGLSIGCFWDAQDERIHWFDTDTLEVTMAHLVMRQSLMVSYNGIAFDFPLMRGILRRRAESLPPDEAQALVALCDAFKLLAARSYDVLHEMWELHPASKFEKGLNSLDSIAQHNGFGGKSGSGAQAPRDWAAGRWAQVLNYCAQDVYLTKSLFELACMGQPIKRRGGKDLLLPLPVFPGEEIPAPGD